MTITILSLGQAQGMATGAELRHDQQTFTALVHGTAEALAASLGQEQAVELSFERILSWRPLPDFDDDADAIIQASTAAPGAIRVCGRVHQVMEPDSHGARIIDLYLRVGPEFLALDTDDLGGHVPVLDSGLEVVVAGLCFYPVNL